MLLLVTGASGVGKSTARRMIERQLDGVVCGELATFVEIPPAPDLAWRQRATEEVVRRALREQGDGRSLLLAGDPVAPGEVVAAPSFDGLDGFAALLLDCSAAAQEQRLRGRGDPPELLPAHRGFLEWMRGHARDPLDRLEVLQAGWEPMRWERLRDTAWPVEVLDTSALGPDAVAAAALAWARRVLLDA